jgi:hypothetical protein
MLWWLLDDPRLSAETRDLMAASPCVVSVASIWEVAIKHRLGKLPVAPAAFRDQSLAAGALLLPVLDGHVIQTAQAQVEGLMALSSDAHWPGYDAPLRRPRHSSTVLGTKLWAPAIAVP